jgi:hypothetical protein
MNSPSPQTIKPVNLLNHFSSGTFGSLSSQRASQDDLLPGNAPLTHAQMSQERFG